MAEVGREVVEKGREELETGATDGGGVGEGEDGESSGGARAMEVMPMADMWVLTTDRNGTPTRMPHHS